MQLEPHQQRVVTEKEELDVKVKALTDFLNHSTVFPKLPTDEKDRLLRQHATMIDYSNILAERITAF